MATSTDTIYNINQRGSNDEDISLQSDFCVFVCESSMHLLDLKDNKIQCRTVDKDSNFEEYVKYVEHMKHIHKSIFGSPRKDPHPLKRDFADTIHYFQNTQPNKKLFCRNEDYYLVKKSFTEGVQYVKQGEMHIYKALAKPLDIYISDRALEPNTLRSNYDAYSISERISPGETKIIPSNTYYIIIAPCHAYFKKVEVDTTGVENSTEISPSFSSETDFQVTSFTENRKEAISSERPNQAEALSEFHRLSMLPQPSGSRHEHGNSRHSMNYHVPLERVDEPEIVNDCTSKSRSFKSDRESKLVRSFTPLTRQSTSQMEVALSPLSPNSLRDEMGLIGSIQAINGTSAENHRRGVFAIRKDGNIQSYTLRSDSTFRVLQDNVMTGSFTIENNNMDPNVIEYHGDMQYIREIAKFKNGSKLRTTLAVHKVLLDQLQDPTKKREEVVVNYFFEFAFNSIEATYRTIEATYRKFSEMRNIKMIGSCVPAIVPLSGAIFHGDVSDVYESKP